MKKINIIIPLIIFPIIVLICIITYWLYSGCELLTPKDSSYWFNKNDIPGLINKFKKEINFNENKLNSRDYVIFIYQPQLVDSSDVIFLYNYKNKQINSAFFKFKWNSELQILDSIYLWNINTNVEMGKHIDFNKMKYLHAYSILPSVLDGVIYYVCYNNRNMVFNNPECGISPFDILLSKIIL